MEKPICESELRELLKNIFCKNICNPGEEVIDFKINGIIYPVNLNEIIYIKYIKGILQVHTTKDVLEVPHIPLTEVQRNMDGMGFLRCSKSVLVNQKYIRSFDFVNQYVELVDGYDSLKMGSVMKKKIRKQTK